MVAFRIQKSRLLSRVLENFSFEPKSIEAVPYIGLCEGRIGLGGSRDGGHLAWAGGARSSDSGYRYIELIELCGADTFIKPLCNYLL